MSTLLNSRRREAIVNEQDSTLHYSNLNSSLQQQHQHQHHDPFVPNLMDLSRSSFGKNFSHQLSPLHSDFTGAGTTASSGGQRQSHHPIIQYDHNDNDDVLPGNNSTQSLYGGLGDGGQSQHGGLSQSPSVGSVNGSVSGGSGAGSGSGSQAVSRTGSGTFRSPFPPIQEGQSKYNTNGQPSFVDFPGFGSLSDGLSSFSSRDYSPHSHSAHLQLDRHSPAQHDQHNLHHVQQHMQQHQQQQVQHGSGSASASSMSAGVTSSMDHSFAPSPHQSQQQQQSPTMAHDGLLALTTHLRSHPTSSHSSLSTPSMTRDLHHRFSMPSSATSSFSQTSSGLSSLNANELGWIQGEMERQRENQQQQQHNQLLNQQSHLQHAQQQQQEQQQQQQQPQHPQPQPSPLGSHGLVHHGGSSSAPGSNRSTGIPDLSALALYDAAGNVNLASAVNVQHPSSTSNSVAGGNGSNNSGSGVMDETKLKKFRTVMCQRMVRTGGCRYGALCDFAHDRHELRRNLDQHFYYPVRCERKHCNDPECRYAHNDHEIMFHPFTYKTRQCSNYTKPGGCSRKMYCSFAHGKQELRTAPHMPVPPQQWAGALPIGNTITAINVAGGSQALPRELVASLQASGINISATNNTDAPHPPPLASPTFPTHRASTGSLINFQAAQKKYLQQQIHQQQQQQQQSPNHQLSGGGHVASSPAASDTSGTVSIQPPPPVDVGSHGELSASPFGSSVSEHLSPSYSQLGSGGESMSSASTGTPASSSLPTPKIHPLRAASEGVNVPPSVVGGVSGVSGDTFRENTDSLKIRILDLVDEVAALHFNKAIDDHSSAMSTGHVTRLMQQFQQATTMLQATKQALAIYSGEESALATLSPNALDNLKLQLQTALDHVDLVRSKHASVSASDATSPTSTDQVSPSSTGSASTATPMATPTSSSTSTSIPRCQSCQSENVSCVALPCAHHVLCASCHPDTCPLCNGNISKIVPVIHDLPPVVQLLATPSPQPVQSNNHAATSKDGSATPAASGRSPQPQSRRSTPQMPLSPPPTIPRPMSTNVERNALSPKPISTSTN